MRRMAPNATVARMIIVRMPDMVAKSAGLVIGWVERTIARNFGHPSVAPVGRRFKADQPRASQRPGTRHRVLGCWCVMCQDTEPAAGFAGQLAAAGGQTLFGAPRNDRIEDGRTQARRDRVEAADRQPAAQHSEPNHPVTPTQKRGIPEHQATVRSTYLPLASP